MIWMNRATKEMRQLFMVEAILCTARGMHSNRALQKLSADVNNSLSSFCNYMYRNNLYFYINYGSLHQFMVNK